MCIRYSSYSVFHQRHVLIRPVSHNDATITWHGVRRGRPDFSEHSHSIAFELKAPARGEHVFVMINAFWEPLSFEIPPPWADRTWHRVIDTSLPAGQDYLPPEQAPQASSGAYCVCSRSVVVLVSQ